MLAISDSEQIRSPINTSKQTFHLVHVHPDCNWPFIILLQLNYVSSARQDEDLPDISCVMGKSSQKSDGRMAVKTEGISSSSPIIVENGPTSSNWNETTECGITC